jgi:hypothetical protein
MLYWTVVYAAWTTLKMIAASQSLNVSKAYLQAVALPQNSSGKDNAVRATTMAPKLLREHKKEPRLKLMVHFRSEDVRLGWVISSYRTSWKSVSLDAYAGPTFSCPIWEVM